MAVPPFKDGYRKRGEAFKTVLKKDAGTVPFCLQDAGTIPFCLQALFWQDAGTVPFCLQDAGTVLFCLLPGINQPGNGSCGNKRDVGRKQQGGGRLASRGRRAK